MKMNACEGVMVLGIKIMVLYGVKLCDQVFYILTMRVRILSGAILLF